MNAIPWIFADDLSGALEAGAAWRAQGWRVRLSLNEAESRPMALTGDLVRLISTETRNLPPEQAYEVMRSALTLCTRSRGALRFKKIDSTLRGPIAAELLALMDTQSPPLVVVTPANPAMGRTVIDGELKVDGKPVAQTEFARDPIWPVLHGSVPRLLREGKVEGVMELRAASRIGLGGLMETIETAIAEGIRVFSADAERPNDLPALVIAVRTFAPRAVFLGSGALAPVLAERCEPAAPLPVARREGGVLYVLGSKHAVTRAQLARLTAQRKVPVVMLSPVTAVSAGERAAQILSREPAVAVAVEEGVKGPAYEVSDAIRAVVGSVITQRAVKAIFATGGETARIVCDVLEGTDLELASEVEPGVVRSVVQTPNGPVTLVVKPGGFGGDDTLLAVADALEKA